MKKFLEIPEAIAQIKRGKMLILVDHPERENEGDFFFPASAVTAEKVNTLIKLGGGIICVALSPAKALQLELPLSVSPFENSEKTGVNFTVSVNSRKGITSGVSAFDRAQTIKILGDKNSKPGDLTRPGHVFPLVANEGGILKRQGHTEAAVALSKMAGLGDSGVLCEIVGKDGRMANLKQLWQLSKKLNVGIVSLEDLVEYIKEQPEEKISPSIIKTAEANLPTKFGDFKIRIYKSLLDNKEHIAMVMGKAKNPVLTRIHSQCLTGDTLFSSKCDCGEQLAASLKMIGKKGEGILIYLSQEGRGIGLSNKIKAYALQDNGMDTVEANLALGLPVDNRDFRVAFEILKDLNSPEIELLTNNPEKITQLEKLGIKIKKHTSLKTKPNPKNESYLLAKKNKLGHILNI